MVIEEIKIYKVDNGYTVRIQYKEENKSWQSFKTLIAPDLAKVVDIVLTWCTAKEVPNE